MRPLTAALRDGAWAGRRAFVVGSGPSLKGFDFSLLAGELWIGCNEEYRHGPTIALVQDLRLFDQGQPGFTPLCERTAWTGGPHLPVYFKGHPDRPAPSHEIPDTVYGINAAHDHLRPFRWGKSLEEGLYYGANVGMAAINLADILGAETIYLLGFDARVDAERSHHHNLYPEGWTLDSVADRQTVYLRWHQTFREIAKMVRARVVNVVNTKCVSGIDAFPMRSMQEVFNL